VCFHPECELVPKLWCQPLMHKVQMKPWTLLRWRQDVKFMFPNHSHWQIVLFLYGLKGRQNKLHFQCLANVGPQMFIPCFFRSFFKSFLILATIVLQQLLESIMISLVYFCPKSLHIHTINFSILNTLPKTFLKIVHPQSLYP